MNEEKESEPVAYLFSNGNVIAFNEEGKQIEEIQKKGLVGLVNFKERFPDADIYFGRWNKGIVPVERLHDSFIDKMEVKE